MGMNDAPGSEKVHDEEQALAMALASHAFRTDAAELRSQIASGVHGGNKAWIDSIARRADERGETSEDVAAQIFKLKQQYPLLSDEELVFLRWQIYVGQSTPKEVSVLFEEKFGKSL